MSSFKGKTLSLERLNNYLQENKPVSNFENPQLSLNLESQKDNMTMNNGEEKIELIQPSGYSISIELEKNGEYIDNAIISGIVEEE